MTSSTKQECYEQFARFLREPFEASFDGKLRFVTDKEKGLYNGFLKVFPVASHALCAIHSRRAVKRKLKVFTGNKILLVQTLISCLTLCYWWFLNSSPFARSCKVTAPSHPDRHLRQSWQCERNTAAGSYRFWIFWVVRQTGSHLRRKMGSSGIFRLVSEISECHLHSEAHLTSQTRCWTWRKPQSHKLQWSTPFEV